MTYNCTHCLTLLGVYGLIHQSSLILNQVLVNCSIFVSSDCRTQIQSKHLANSSHLGLWLDERKGFILAHFPNIFKGWRLCFIVGLETNHDLLQISICDPWRNPLYWVHGGNQVKSNRPLLSSQPYTVCST